MEFLANMSKPTWWGDHVSFIACAEVIGRPIVVHNTADPAAVPQVVPTTVAQAAELPVVLAFQHELHYQAAAPIEEAVPVGALQGEAHAGRKRYKINKKLNPIQAAKYDPELCLRCGSVLMCHGCVVCGSDQKPPSFRSPHPIGGCLRRPEPKKVRGERGSSRPNSFGPHYSCGPDGAPVKAKKGKVFRSMVQPSFNFLSKLTEAQSQNHLFDF